MKRLEYRPLKQPYRRATIYSFILTVGAVNSVLGFVSLNEPVLLCGLGTVGIAITLQWWQARSNRSHIKLSAENPVFYLPDRASRIPKFHDYR